MNFWTFLHEHSGMVFLAFCVAVWGTVEISKFFFRAANGEKVSEEKENDES